MYEISIMCNLLAYKKDKNKMLDQMACKWLLWEEGCLVLECTNIRVLLGRKRKVELWFLRFFKNSLHPTWDLNLQP